MDEPFQDQDPPFSPSFTSEVSVDFKVAETAGMQLRLLQRNNTLQIDKIGELRGEQDLHVFSADYDVYALPKYQ